MDDMNRRTADAIGQLCGGGALAVATLQLGLYCTLRAMGIGPGTRVACDPVFPFATLAALHAGAEVVHPTVEIHDRGYHLSLAHLDADAAVVTQPFGWPLAASIDKASMPLVVDAALSPLAQAEWRPDVHAIGFSFAASKPVSTGEGGLMLFGRSELHRCASAWGRFGVGDEPGPPTVPGLNVAMSPALVPILEESVRVAVQRKDLLDESWRVVRAQLTKSTLNWPAHGSAGWYRPVLRVGAHRAPEQLEAGGVTWKLCRLAGPAAEVCGSRAAGPEVSKLVERLAWYRPTSHGSS